MKQVKWMKRVTITAGVLALGAWGLTAEPANATFIKDPSPGGIHFNIDLANKDVSTFSGKVGTDVVNVATIGNVNTGSGYANIDPVKDGTDWLLTGSRGVPSLIVGASSTDCRQRSNPTTSTSIIWRALAAARRRSSRPASAAS